MLFLRISAIVLASAGAFAQTTTPASTRQLTFPPVGIGSGETVEVNLANLAANSSAGTAASCAGTVSFMNAAGTSVQTAQPFTLTTGQAASVRLPFSTSGITGTRGVVRAIVTLNLPSATPRPPCSLAVTLQTYDTTSGATHALISDEVAGYGDHR